MLAKKHFTHDNQTGGDVRFRSAFTHMVKPIRERIDSGKRHTEWVEMQVWILGSSEDCLINQNSNPRSSLSRPVASL